MKSYFAVMGAPISHSLSPVVFEHFAREHKVPLIYDKIQVEPASFISAVRTFFDKGGQGLNITAPLKELAFKLAKHHSKTALAAKSANVLYLNEDGELCAGNSDGFGLSESLSDRLELAGKSVLLLGSGGAAKGVICALLAKGVSLSIGARNETTRNELMKSYPEVAVCALDELKPPFDIVINATSASAKGEVPAISAKLVNNALTIDMVYDRNETVFQRWCLDNGAKEAIDGLSMLVYQAARSFEIFTGILPNGKNALVFLK